MQVFWSDDFDRQLSRFEKAAAESARDERFLDLLAAMLTHLRDLAWGTRR